MDKDILRITRKNLGWRQKRIMTEVRTTENEFRSHVTSWLNAAIHNGGYPFENASEDPRLAMVWQKYRTYLKGIREELMQAFVRRTGDESISERLTAEVMEGLTSRKN